MTQDRTAGHATKEKAALASIAASALLTIGKLVAGLLSGSLALISEAGHALLDTGATILTYFAIREAHKPADDEHHYGHGKIEAVAALAETGLLAVLAVGVADALHFSSDLVGSVCVVLGLIGVSLGYPRADAFAALGVSLFIGIAGYRLGRKTIDTLVDAAPKGLADRLRVRAQDVAGVVGVETLRLRPTGPEIIGELHINVPRTMPLERVASVKQNVAGALAQESPDSRITVIADPVALDDESVLELVLLIAARRRLPVHHVTVQDIGAKKSISLDVELDGRMSLAQAHEIVSGLEDAIEAELGNGVEVETHMEPLEIEELAGQDVSDTRGEEMTRILAEAARDGGVISDVHDVRVRQTASGLVVNYHCHAPETLSVDAVHEAVDGLDHRLRRNIAEVTRVVGHAEPLR